MPELPEVETVVRSLNKRLKGLTIEKVEIFYPKIIKSNQTVKDFENIIKNKKIDNIERIAKYIIFRLQDKVLISHLRMEGKWFVYDKNEEYDKKHVLATFHLSNNKLLNYHDTRRFGTFNLEDVNEYLDINPIKKIGPEPFNSKVDGNFLYEKMKNSSRHIKTMLLDQTIISGIGNIYADEILFDAKINPLITGDYLIVKDYDRIAESARKILKKSIELGGTTIDTYQPEQGIDGKFQNELKVHTRKGQNCYECQSEIVKIKVNGRGTYYCKNCQK
ncbi:DNA-formamidopyrimidine glycosylase [Spiroplasma tabanidicola]|uniref:Formamidopyrimidine-DNA glycosylase n=1 Tax=Spiroplasma tabanidicola TaxID=324079 RepID=A0A6I6C9I8_9MOLU|nr:DNA-formamidopyrimidine glycosylase [Spiroplasma tabanidicola]QGS52256.1 formamidopyrimidine-DNA glycosylase [Spiroplasma tabanidicola]